MKPTPALSRRPGSGCGSRHTGRTERLPDWQKLQRASTPIQRPAAEIPETASKLDTLYAAGHSEDADERRAKQLCFRRLARSLPLELVATRNGTGAVIYASLRSQVKLNNAQPGADQQLPGRRLRFRKPVSHGGRRQHGPQFQPTGAGTRRKLSKGQRSTLAQSAVRGHCFQPLNCDNLAPNQHGSRISPYSSTQTAGNRCCSSPASAHCRQPRLKFPARPGILLKYAAPEKSLRLQLPRPQDHGPDAVPPAPDRSHGADHHLRQGAGRRQGPRRARARGEVELFRTRSAHLDRSMILFDPVNEIRYAAGRGDSYEDQQLWVSGARGQLQFHWRSQGSFQLIDYGLTRSQRQRQRRIHRTDRRAHLAILRELDYTTCPGEKPDWQLYGHASWSFKHEEGRGDRAGGESSHSRACPSCTRPISPFPSMTGAKPAFFIPACDPEAVTAASRSLCPGTGTSPPTTMRLLEPRYISPSGASC